MRIGINALYLIPGGVGGTEIYLRNLLRALAEIDDENEYFVFTNRETEADLVPARFHHVPQGVRAAFRPGRLIYEQTGLPLAAAISRLDVMLNPGFTAPAIAACPNVTVFHDLQHKRHPEHFRRSDLPFWNLFLWLALKRSRLLLADSETTRADLVRFYDAPISKIRVVPLGVEQEFFSILPNRKPEKFLLCVSTLHPHKNLYRLVRVFSRFRRHRPEYKLVIAGLRGFYADELENLIGDLGLTTSVRLTGWIPREVLYDLYRRAGIFVYPSTFEGFGLPVLEAMAAGVPLACSAIEPLSTIAGDAAMRFAPDDETAMFEAISCLAADKQLCEKMTARGVARARAFSWHETARKTLEALISAGNLRAGSSLLSSRRDT